MFSCPHCGQSQQVPDNLLGQVLACVNCQGQFQTPASNPTQPTAQPEVASATATQEETPLPQQTSEPNPSQETVSAETNAQEATNELLTNEQSQAAIDYKQVAHKAWDQTQDLTFRYATLIRGTVIAITAVCLFSGLMLYLSNQSIQIPQLASIEPLQGIEGRVIDFTLENLNEKIEKGNLRFYPAEELPDGFIVGESTGMVSWLPEEKHGPGTFDFFFILEDKKTGLSDQTKVQITVEEAPQKPDLKTIPQKTFVVGEEIRFNVSASEQDLPKRGLEYAIVGEAPAGLKLDPKTGEFHWVPNLRQTREYHEINVKVTTALDQSVETMITFLPAETDPVKSITETKSNITFVEFPQLTAMVGEKFTYQVQASDSQATEAPTFELMDGAPEGIAINPTTGALTWSPTPEMGGKSVELTVKAVSSDKSRFERKTFSIQIGIGPQIEDIEDITVILRTPLPPEGLATIPIIATDVAEPPAGLTYKILKGSDIIRLRDNVMQLVPKYGGEFPVTVLVSSKAENGYSSKKTFNVTVLSGRESEIRLLAEQFKMEYLVANQTGGYLTAEDGSPVPDPTDGYRPDSLMAQMNSGGSVFLPHSRREFKDVARKKLPDGTIYLFNYGQTTVFMFEAEQELDFHLKYWPDPEIAETKPFAPSPQAPFYYPRNILTDLAKQTVLNRKKLDPDRKAEAVEAGAKRIGNEYLLYGGAQEEPQLSDALISQLLKNPGLEIDGKGKRFMAYFPEYTIPVDWIEEFLIGGLTLAGTVNPDYKRDVKKPSLRGKAPKVIEAEIGKEITFDFGATGKDMEYYLGIESPGGAKIDPKTGKFSWTPGPKTSGMTYSFSAKARAGEFGSLPLWVPITIKIKPAVWNFDRSIINATKFSPDGTKILFGLVKNGAVLIESSTGAILKKFENHKGAITDVDFAPGGGSIYLSSIDKTISKWGIDEDTISEEEPTLVLDEHQKSVTSISANPNGTQLASGDLEGAVYIRDALTGDTVNVFVHDPALPVLTLRYTPDGSRLVTSTAAGVFVWNPENGQVTRTFKMGDTNQPPPSPGFQDIQFSGGSNYTICFLPSANKKQSVIGVFATNNGNFIKTLNTESPVAIHPDGERFFYVADNKIHLQAWPYQSEALPSVVAPERLGSYAFKGVIKLLKINPAGTKLLVVTPNGNAQLIDVESAKIPLPPAAK